MKKLNIIDLSSKNLLLGSITVGLFMLGFTICWSDSQNSEPNKPVHDILSSDYLSESVVNKLNKTKFVYEPDKYDKIDKIDKKYYNKIKKVLIKTSGIDKDPYNRKIGKDIIKLFCAIAIYHGIKINDEIDDKTFDMLYKELVNYQLDIYNKNKN